MMFDISAGNIIQKGAFTLSVSIVKWLQMDGKAFKSGAIQRHFIKNSGKRGQKVITIHFMKSTKIIQC